jgi:hypothetical protein
VNFYIVVTYFDSTYGSELDQGASDRKFLEEIINDLTLSSQVEIKGDVLSCKCYFLTRFVKQEFNLFSIVGFSHITIARFMNKERPAAPLKESSDVCIVVSSFEGIYINSGIGTAYSALAEYLVAEGKASKIDPQ